MQVFVTNWTLRQLTKDVKVTEYFVWEDLERVKRFLTLESIEELEKMYHFLEGELEDHSDKSSKDTKKRLVNIGQGLKYHNNENCEFFKKDYENWPIPKNIPENLIEKYRQWFKNNFNQPDFKDSHKEKWGFVFEEEKIVRKFSGEVLLNAKSVDEVLSHLEKLLSQLTAWLKEGDNESYLTSLKARNFQLHPPPPMARDQEKLKTWFDVFNREHQQPIKSTLQTALHFKFGKFFSGKESELEAKGFALCKSCAANELLCDEPTYFQFLLEERGVIGPSNKGGYCCAHWGFDLDVLMGLNPQEAFYYILNASKLRHDKQKKYKLTNTYSLKVFMSERGINKFEVLSDQDGLPVGRFWIGSTSVYVQFHYSSLLMQRKHLDVNHLYISTMEASSAEYNNFFLLHHSLTM